MKSKRKLSILMAGLLIIVTLSFLFLTLLDIAFSIQLYVASGVIVSLLYVYRVKRHLKWMIWVLPMILGLFGIITYVITLLLNSPGDGFGIGLLLLLSITFILISIMSLCIYQILENSYYPDGTYQKTDQTYLSNEWILFVFVINMFIFQVFGYVRGLEIMRILLELLILLIVTVALYFILFFLNKRQKNMNLFSLVGLLFIGTYIGYAYISQAELPFYASSGSHLLLIYFLIKDYFNKKRDQRERH